MPHSSKKYRQPSDPIKKTSTITYIVVAVVVAIIAISAGFYAYSSLKSTPTTTPPTSTLTTSGASGDYAILNTTQGTIEVQLFPSVAPKTVANFIHLANTGFYNNLVWHRIVKGFVIQTGDPTTRNAGGNPASWGSGSSNTTVPLETNSTVVAEGYVNNEGYLAMARGQDPNSGSSQFFINIGNNTSLNGQYTVFGKVISGMNVALAIGKLPVSSQCQSSGGLTCPPSNPQQAMLLSVTIINAPENL